MITISSDQYLNSLSYSSDCIVPSQDFSPFRERIINQLTKTVQVPGFRPGKVPEKLAMQSLDPEKVNQIVTEETISKFLPEFVSQVKAKLAQEGRVILNQQITFKTNTGIQEDGSFVFSLVFGLLPQVDLSPAKKIVIPTITNADIPELLSQEVFIKNETNLLLKNVNDLRLKDSKDIFENIEVAFEKEELLQKQYSSLEDFEKLLTNIYNQELESTKTRIQNDRLIAVLIKTTPDFDLPTNLITEEIKRISDSMVARSVETKTDLNTIWEQSGLNKNKLKIENPEDLSKGIGDVLKDEFKLMYTLRFIYETLSDKKVGEEDVENLVKRYREQPQSFNIPSDMPVEELENRAFDQLMRAIAFDRFRELISGN